MGHNIATHYYKNLLLFIVCVFLVTSSICNAQSWRGDKDSRVIYRVANGKTYKLYVLNRDKSVQENNVKAKIKFWNSFMNCRSGYQLKSNDVFFSNQSVEMTVNSNCSASVKVADMNTICVASPNDIIELLDLLDNDLHNGFGVEYITPHERVYLKKNCK